MNQKLQAKLKKVRMVILDVDGVLTDGRVWIGEDGEEHKAFHIHDGHAIKAALGAGLGVAFLTGRSSSAVERRAAELGVKEVHQGIADKAAAYGKLKAAHGLRDEDVCCVGDDLPDLGIVTACGFGVAVGNGVEELRAAADYVTSKDGGRGAVREVIQMILKAQGEWPEC